MDQALSELRLANPSLLRRSKGRLYIRRRNCQSSTHHFQRQHHYDNRLGGNDESAIINKKDDCIIDTVNDDSTVTTWTDSTLRSEQIRPVASAYRALTSIESKVHEYRPPSFSHSDSFTFKSLLSNVSDSRSAGTEGRDDTQISIPTLKSDYGSASVDGDDDDESATFDRYAVPDDDDDDNKGAGEDSFFPVTSFARDYGCCGDLCEKIGFQTSRPPTPFKTELPQYISDSSRSIIPMRGRNERNQNHVSGNWDDEVVPMESQGAKSYIDLVNGRGRNIFLGMLIECIEQASIPVFSAVADKSGPNSEVEYIMSTTSIVLREILGVNLSITSRNVRLTKALDSRKGKAAIHDKEVDESTFHEKKRAASEDPSYFNVDLETRQSRLSKALHRGKGDSTRDSSMSCDYDSGTQNHHLTSRVSVIKHRIARVTRILKSRHYFDEEERTQHERKLSYFRLALTAFLFRFLSRKQIHLAYINGPVVLFNNSTKNLSSPFIDLLLLLTRIFHKYGWYDVNSFERGKLAVEVCSTDTDLLVDVERDVEIDEFSTYIPPVFIQEFVKKVDDLTDLTAEYISAHSILSNDCDGDDDGLMEELINLQRIEQELKGDILTASQFYLETARNSIGNPSQTFLENPLGVESMGSVIAMDEVCPIEGSNSSDDSSDYEQDDSCTTETDSAFDVEEAKKAVLDAVKRIQGKLSPSDHILTEGLPKLQQKMMSDLMLLSRTSRKHSTRNMVSQDSTYCIEVEPETVVSSISFRSLDYPTEGNDDSDISPKGSLSFQELGIDDGYPRLLNFSSASSDSFEGSFIMGLTPSLMDDDSVDDSYIPVPQAANKDGCMAGDRQSASVWNSNPRHAKQCSWSDSDDLQIRKKERKTVWCTLLDGHPKRESEKKNKKNPRCYPKTLNSASFSAFEQFDGQDQVLWRAKLQDAAHLYPVVDVERKLAIEKAFKVSLEISRGKRAGVLQNMYPDENIRKSDGKGETDQSSTLGDRGKVSILDDEGNCSAPFSELSIGRISQDFSGLEFTRGRLWNETRYTDMHHRDSPTDDTGPDPPIKYESDLEAQSELPSFQVIRSMDSSMTEFFDQKKSNPRQLSFEDIDSPVWSLSPIINSFSSESGGISDPDWSLSPEITPRQTRADIEIHKATRESKPWSDYNSSETKRHFTFASSYQSVLQCAGNKARKPSPRSGHGLGDGEQKKTGLQSKLSKYWQQLLNAHANSGSQSGSQRDSRDDSDENMSNNRSVTTKRDARIYEYSIAESKKNDEGMKDEFGDVLLVDPSGHYSNRDFALKEHSLACVNKNEKATNSSILRLSALDCSNGAITRFQSNGEHGLSQPLGKCEVYDPFEAATKIPEAFSGTIMMHVNDPSNSPQRGWSYIDEKTSMAPEEGGGGIEAFILPINSTMNQTERTRTNALSDISGSTEAIYSDSQSTQWSASVTSSSGGIEVSEDTSMSTSFPISAVNVVVHEPSDDERHPLQVRSEVKTSPIPESGLLGTIKDLFFFDWTSRRLNPDRARDDIRKMEERLRGVTHY